MRVLDIQCHKCEHTEEVWVKEGELLPLCSKCNSDLVEVVWLQPPIAKREFRPYDKFLRQDYTGYERNITSQVPKNYRSK